MHKARTETFEHAISSLLSKRADLLGEAERLRDRIAAIKNDLDALDRTLNTLGYEGDLDAMMPRQKRHVVFGKGELFRSCMDVLRDADGPMTSRQIAQGYSVYIWNGCEGPAICHRPNQARRKVPQTKQCRPQGCGRQR
jgi:hypothetical protein